MAPDEDLLSLQTGHARSLNGSARQGRQALAGNYKRRPDVQLNARKVPRPMTQQSISCGSELEPFTTSCFYEDRPMPTFLPIDYSEHVLHPQNQHKLNPCGARIHAASIPKHKDGVWTGNLGGVTPCVIPLEEMYVPAETATRMAAPRRDACGCEYGYVGCTVCGNPLGILFTLCPSHLSAAALIYSFLASAVSPPLPLPAESLFPLPLPIPPRTPPLTPSVVRSSRRHLLRPFAFHPSSSESLSSEMQPETPSNPADAQTGVAMLDVSRRVHIDCGDRGLGSHVGLGQVNLVD
ncbi:hypothetical protein DFH09DRAFT_1102268 [Mycena vulgaris]|nr:hypothetical protein DFH09DRAFT_1102268 [Mycena vulgaris]